MQLRIFSAPPPILRPHRAPEVALPAIAPRRRPAHTPSPAMATMPATMPDAMPALTAVTQLAPAAPIAPPVDEVAAITTPVTVPVPAATIASPTDAAITSVLASANPYGESVATAYARKERELAALFAGLSVAEAQQLHTRLATPIAGDVVAAQFERLVADRRARLLALLAGASRRAMTKHDRRAA